MRKNLFVLLCIAALIFGFAGLAAAYDFGGGTVRISGTFPDAKNFGIDFNDARGRGHIENVEEMFNCKIMWIDDNSSYVPETFMANILAGDPSRHPTFVSGKSFFPNRFRGIAYAFK